jgi:hypothetical protein
LQATSDITNGSFGIGHALKTWTSVSEEGKDEIYKSFAGISIHGLIALYGGFSPDNADKR